MAIDLIWFDLIRNQPYHGTGTEIRYQDLSALPWSKMATATTGKDVYTAIILMQWWLDFNDAYR